MKQLSLNGQWRMRDVAEKHWHDAKVPGSVYADYLRDGTIPDPFYRENELEAFELLYHDFEYQRTFSLTKEQLQANRVLLHCDGLDTLAHVSVNGKKIGYADNMHITWEWEVKSALKEGENEIAIHFDSPIVYALKEGAERPCWYSTDALSGFQHVRKAHCMYGWDWGPRLPDAGIWRDITLLFIDEARLSDVLVLQEHGDNVVRLTICPDIDAKNPDALRWTAVLTATDGKEYHAEEGVITVQNPLLWWPAGYGDQPLYKISVTLNGDKGVQDTWEKRIGLRTLWMSREKDEWGEEFCHIVNGVKIFAMGADYIPEDNIFSRRSPERTRILLQDARLANFNCIRVWGGGYYPDNFFFDICDELGLLVWQDLMYACAYYELTPAFEKSIRLEAEQNVKRLRHHASLALFCGNNEMEMFQLAGIKAKERGDFKSYGPSRPQHHADYIKMFEYILSGVCEGLAPQTFYWPASPSSGGAFDEPNAENRGDVHYWEVWHGEKPFTDYRKFHFRYASEFGFQSFPCLKTVESFTLPEDRNIFSRVMERHQRNTSANGKILNYISQTYLYPYSFDNLLYCSQLLQADAIRYGVEHWRRNRNRCMGAVIWQLNDCWPVASWASIDYFGRWKALHYAAKRFFAPVMISACEEGEITQNPNIIEFHADPIRRSARLNVANETRAAVKGTVHWALRHANGKAIEKGTKAITVPALSSVWLDEMDFPNASLTEDYFSFSFETEAGVISEGTALFCAPKHFGFIDPKLSVSVKGDEITVSAAVFAKHVYVEGDDPDMLLSDNFFDLNADQKTVKVLRGKAENLRTRSVYNLGKEQQ